MHLWFWRMPFAIIDELSHALFRMYPICQRNICCERTVPAITGRQVHRRFTGSSVGTLEDAEIAPIIARKRSHRACEARLLFRDSLATLAHSHGRKAVNNANLPSMNWPLESTNRSIAGKLKSNSSEMTFTTANAAPRVSADRATAAASTAAACAPSESRRLAFCAGLATEPKLTSVPSPCSKL